MSHTPGPWEFVLHDDGIVSGVTFEIRMGSRLGGANGWQTQHQIEYNSPDYQESPTQFEEAEANARLIASAPELLAALKDLVEVDDTQGVDRRMLDAGAAAIAKAEGRS